MCNPMAELPCFTGQTPAHTPPSAAGAAEAKGESKGSAQDKKPAQGSGSNHEVPAGMPRSGLFDFMPSLLSGAMTRMFAERHVEDEELRGAPGRPTPEGRLLSDPSASRPSDATQGSVGGRGFKQPDKVDQLNTGGRHGAGPMSEGNGLYERIAGSLDDDATLSTEAQYLAMNLQYEAVSRTSGGSRDMGNAAVGMLILGAAVMVVAIALAPETGGASLVAVAL